MKNDVVGIICALQNEADSLVSDLTDATCETLFGMDFTYGKLCGKSVVVAVSGVGKVFSARCTQTMIMRYSPREIINSGAAGAISPELKIYDIVIASKLVQHDFDTTLMGEPLGCIINGSPYLPMTERLTKAFSECSDKLGYPCRIGTLATGDQFIGGDEVKQRIFGNFGAIACDMEGAAIGTVCYTAGVDCAVMRCISDSGNGTEYSEFSKNAAKRSCDVIKEYLKTK